MAKTVDLWVTYKKTKQRVARAHDQETSVAAQNAADLAYRAFEHPTLRNVAKFRTAENRWRKLASVNTVALADEFEDAIRVGLYTNQRPHIKSFANGANPVAGFIYCLVTADHPGDIKIGYTTQAPDRRARQLRTKYKLTNAKITYSREVAYPAQIEDSVHTTLRANLVTHRRFKGSSEWFNVPHSKVVAAIRQAIRKRNAG